MKIKEAEHILCEMYKKIMDAKPNDYKSDEQFKAICVAMDVIDRFTEIQGRTKGIK